MNESSALRSVSVSDGRMAIEGSQARYVQGAARRFRLRAAGLRFVGGYESRDGRLDDGQRILAEAHVADGSLRRAGTDGEAGAIGLVLRRLAASGEPPRLLLMLGYRQEGDAEVPFAEAFLAPAVFDALKADMLTGLAQEITLSATTSLWVREEDRALAEGHSLVWYLAPDADGRAIVPARGFIESIEWSSQLHHEPAAVGAPTAQAAAVPDQDSDEDWQESSAEQLRRINWSFKQLLLLLAFLMIIIAVK
ncbi:conserved hypothetical protein [Hyphomicrobiales bacterium]|nr:conserved hypothetical protein [Hyphomicrobiales bacterium]CAH1697932.1 conserved hypothetical protein [Hyphomicrobiales bacterium]CAI0347579.1 conserved hypothetical protein [Hyphomicrobiales bacterium]